MSARPNNPYAFPNNDSACIERNGMTLRDWFAGQALAGVLANPGTPDQMIGLGFHGSKAMLTEYALAVADAMLAARGDAS